MIENKANSTLKFEDFSYEVINGDAVIYEYCGEKRTLVVPSYINGYSVVEFNMYEYGSDAVPFVEHVVLPGTIQRLNLGSRNNIKTVRFEYGCTYIPNFAFAGMKHLELIDLPDSVERIGQAAFEYCASLKYIRIPEGCLYIGDDAFAYTSLNRLWIPKSVKEMGNNPFCGSDNLSLYLHPENQHFVLVDEMVLYTADYTRLIRCYPSYPKILDVPENLMLVDSCALMGCELYGFNISDKCKAFEGMNLKDYLI